MNQSGVLRHIYESIYQELVKLGAEKQIFSMKNDLPVNDQGGESYPSTVFMKILDICQISQDKNGQKIMVEDIAFEAPTRVGCIIAFDVVGGNYPDILETIGALIRYFKDNNTIVIDTFSWHGNDEKIAYIEPIVGEPDGRRGLVQTPMSLSLKYTIEIGINSEKGTPFRRVEARKIQGNIMNNEKNG
jgi:hypothetical protein